MFYVINLERRVDRKKLIIDKWERLGMESPLIFCTGVDGTKVTDKCMINNKYRFYTKEYNNNFDRNPRTLSVIYSHLEVINRIANGEMDYGVIFEDDISFKDSFKDDWESMLPSMEKMCNEDIFDIIYLGCGDTLPSVGDVYVNNIKYNYFGNPKGVKKSQYVHMFDCFGAFSYCVSKKSARRLLDIAFFDNIRDPFHIWLKNSITSQKRYVTVPLLTYHPLDVEDSDPLGIICDRGGLQNNLPRGGVYNICFLIPVGDGILLYECVKCILDNAKYPDNIMFAFYSSFDMEGNKKLHNIRELCRGYGSYVCSMRGKIKSITELHHIYNNIWKCYFRCGKFFAIWNDSSRIVTKDWDEKFLNMYKLLGDPRMGCFYLSGSLIVQSDYIKFNNALVTRDFLLEMGCVSPIANFNGFINMVAGLCNIINCVRNVKMELGVSDNSPREDKYLYNILYDSVHTKYFVEKAVGFIKKKSFYRACGVWSKVPTKFSKLLVLGNPNNYEWTAIFQTPGPKGLTAIG